VTTLYTVGHSRRSPQELVALLREAGVRRIVDVRRWPASRRHPHFGRAPLAATLAQAGVQYVHEVDLGGHRDTHPDSPHTSLDDPAWRGYADHMQTAAFGAALERVLAGARSDVTALLCAEALPEHCHRRFIADALLARGVAVVHLVALGSTADHQLSPTARIEPGGGLVYDGGQLRLELGPGRSSRPTKGS